MQPFDFLEVRRTRVALVVGSAIAIALVTSSHISDNLAARGISIPFGTLLSVELLKWLMWAAFVPVIAAVERRKGIATSGWRRGLLAHLLAASVLSAVANLVMTPIVAAMGLGENRSLFQVFLTRAVSRLPDAFGTYALIAGVLWLIALARERYRQETRAALLEAQLSEARLRALQGQLQPHFLFNTLNMVAGLIREHRNDTAVDAIAELAELLRRTLRDIERQEVTLGEELAWLDVYLSIQKRRFGALLNLQDDIAPDVRSALIPPFLLQPIVENAVMHGLERSSGGTIILRASRSHGALRLEVEDNGAGIRPNYVEGVGLRATRDRLDARHGAAASLVVTDAIPHGTLVRITLPDGVQ